MCALVCNQNACGEPAPNPCNQCPADCNPCALPAAYPPCPPGGDCNCPCDCNDFSSCCYQQPARTQPIRPAPNLCRSGAPMDTDTIYKRSFYANCGDCYRAKPVLPCNNLKTTGGTMDTCTIQKLSFMPPCVTSRTCPIKPRENGLCFRGPMYWITSQKHDFVPKGYCKREPLKPPNALCATGAPLDNCTINKLSFMPNDICRNPPPKPIRPKANLLLPCGPIDSCTIQKLSYMPVCLPAKEPLPWAAKIRCVPPNYEKLCTTYNLSYMPNCNACRTMPVSPMHGLKSLGSDIADRNTVYKLSYMPVDCRSCRPAPIRPSHGLCLPGGPMESCTIQKLSYQPNCCPQPAKPVRPKLNCIQPCGPVYHMTTNKHDFVPKPICRRSPIKPPPQLCSNYGKIDSCTINKLSYQPNCGYRPPAPIKPAPGLSTTGAPIESCTTYKLSYLPNCPQPKEPLPWARAATYCRPTAPIEKCTIQRLSYGPPGTFSKCGGCCSNPCGGGAFPTAGIC